MLTKISELVDEVRRGQHIMIDEEYKERGYNADRHREGSNRYYAARGSLLVYGYDEKGERLEPTKRNLADQGQALVTAFCKLNNIPVPKVTWEEKDQWPFGACGFYRPEQGIVLCISECASIGKAGAAWSFPGYVIDRTPYGVHAHEVGHHVDWLSGTDGHKGRYWSDYSEKMRAATGEPKLTNYCPNDAEWFAEIFRLFVTNPDLLMRLRPLTFNRLIKDGWKPLFEDTWCERIMTAPERTVVTCAKKILAVSST